MHWKLVIVIAKEQILHCFLQKLVFCKWWEEKQYKLNVFWLLIWDLFPNATSKISHFLLKKTFKSKLIYRKCLLMLGAIIKINNWMPFSFPTGKKKDKDKIMWTDREGFFLKCLESHMYWIYFAVAKNFFLLETDIEIDSSWAHLKACIS